MKSAVQLKQVWATNPDGLTHAFGEMLREFGYETLTDECVRGYITDFYAGKPVAKDVVAIMIYGYLEKGI